MSKKRRTNAKTNKKQLTLEFLITFFIAIMIIVFRAQYDEANQNFIENSFANTNKITAEESENIVLNENSSILQIHFFDVGQADSILLISNEHAMLIDAGNNQDGTTVVNNIKNLGITKLDYVVGTHPHADHIGGLDNVISNFDIGTIYMPKIQTNTKTFEDVLDAAQKKNLKIKAPKQGDKFTLGDAECEIMLAGIGSKDEEENLNLSSIAIRATYKEQSYLFMADAESQNEASRTWPQTNVLKVGHHGSNTSSSEEFLKQVNPQIAIIQVGKDNDYHHPHKVTLNKLNKLSTLIYRTDEKGNILLESDGINNKISFY